MCLVRLFLFGLFLLPALPSIAPGQIHADVTVSGGVNGTFRISLEHEKAPATVANFIRLATGSHGWIDSHTGAIRHDPFYDGVSFHRVVADFVSQAGSRAGDGSDGPGYKFRDEIDSSLSHNSAYVVAMANSGRNTNGSQFYITAGAQTHLDGIHSIFGRVIEGQEVCDEINGVDVNNGRPDVPILIQSISLGGPSFAGFELDQSLLPTLHDARPVLKRNGSTFTLGYDRLPYSTYILSDSIDLADWTSRGEFYFHGAPSTSDLDITSIATGPAHFYRIARVDYSEASPNTLGPSTVHGKSFTFTGSFLYVTQANFNAAGTGGTWTTDQPSNGSIKASEYRLDPYSPPELFVEWNSTTSYGFDVWFFYQLTYTSPTGGTFTGQTNVANYSNINGTFTVTDITPGP